MTTAPYVNDDFEVDGPSPLALGIADEVRAILTKMGEDPEREGLQKTPLRVDRSLAYLTNGYRMSVADVVNGAIFHENVDDMVIVRDVEFYSMCEHHMLPFFGNVHVAYIPNGRIIGLSKIPRIVEVFSRRLQVQERMTRQISNALMEVLGARGVGVITEARHLCMMMRGVEKQQSSTISSCMLGVFRDNRETRQEFLDLINNPIRA